MKRGVVFLLLALFIGTSLNAQRWRLQRYRLYVGLTSMNYFGDIGGSASENNFWGLGDLDLSYSRPALHIGALFKYQRNLDFKLNFYYGSFYGMDEDSKNENRDLQFHTNIFEPSVQVSYIFFTQQRNRGSGRIFSRKGMLNSFAKFEGNIFAGIGAAIFSPDAEFKDGTPISERNGGTEFSTSTSATAIFPVGLGLIYVVNNQWEIGLDIGGRITLSDYIDGFSSQYSTSKDVYYFTTLSMIYRIRSDRKGRPLLLRSY